MMHGPCLLALSVLMAPSVCLGAVRRSVCSVRVPIDWAKERVIMRMFVGVLALLGLSTACWAQTKVTVVPEPSSLMALGAGAVGLGLALWRRRR